MAKPATRSELKEYCLRKLGKPVLQINVDDTQIEDRIDDAIQWWNENHVDGSSTVYFKHQFTSQDITNKYIDLSTIPKEIMTIDSLIAIEGGDSEDKMLSRLWQFTASIEDMITTGGSLTEYVTQMSYLNSMKYFLSDGYRYQFSRFDNTLKIHGIKWDNVTTDTFVVIEATVASTSNIWNERLLKLYTTASIKKQWGENMKKFGEVVLIGGVTMRGQEIWDEARDEMTKIEEEVYDTPLDFYIA